MQNDNQPRTHFTPRNQPPARPHLAPNVVCMFNEERPPVQQTRTRGRYPLSIARFASRPRLMPGDIAELAAEGWSGRVIVLKERASYGFRKEFQVAGLDEYITGEGQRFAMVTLPADHLRLIKCGGPSEWARVEREVAWFEQCKEERIASMLDEAIRNMRPDPAKN
ncbi:hypothetical protein LLG90_08220 [Aromatoleum toluclasticum]|uniref:hypothetical protein n=1 Tax=Aromatoleum toluclasticum TaxID=92003 RepID=UPI001D1926E4|nr:hypothetical protein [Aromatoleum toluclasticum]MCC4115329.1 hypothetical protein [Aromatoleum toluclasticum]